MQRIELDIKYYPQNLGGHDPNDEWSRDSTDCDISFGGTFKLAKDTKWGGDLSIDFIPQRDKDYFLLYVKYSTGDSFGNDGGQLEIIDLYESEELALEQMRKIEEDYKIYQKNSMNSDYSINLLLNGSKPVRLSCAWKGYFEHMEDVGVETFRLK